MFYASRPVKRGYDGTLTMFQDRFINMLKAAIQNVSNTEIHDSTKELYDRLKEETKELREKDIEDPFSRDDQPGQRSEEVIHRGELCDTFGISTGAMALSLKDRDNKGHDTINKNGRIGKDPPAFYSFKA